MKLDQISIQKLQIKKLKKILAINDNAVTDVSVILDQYSVHNKKSLMRELPETAKSLGLSLDGIKHYIDEYSPNSPLLNSKYIISTTSGTSGNKGYFINTAQTLNKLKAVLIARNIRSKFTLVDFLFHLIGPRYRMTMVSPNSGPYISSQVMACQPRIASLLLKTQNLSIFSSVEDLVDQLNTFKPHYIHVYPSVLEQLSLYKLNGLLKICPTIIAVSSEPLSKTSRELAKKAFGLSNISNIYSSTECLSIASECKYEKMHINMDVAIVEPYKESGKYSMGELADGILVTNLINNSQAIIRYKMDDKVRFTGETCQCGCVFPVIELEGRIDDTILLQKVNGDYVPIPPIPLEIIMLDFEKIYLYKITHIEQNHILIYIDKTDDMDLTRKLKKRFIDYFTSCGINSTITVSIKKYVYNHRNRPQKIKQIENRVKYIDAPIQNEIKGVNK